MDVTQREQIASGRGFFAALDQSGGSTPKALAEYGIEKDRYRDDAEMFDLVHAMRTRVLTSPAFDGSRVPAWRSWVRQLKPSASTATSGSAARTAGSSTRSAHAIDTA